MPVSVDPIRCFRQECDRFLLRTPMGVVAVIAGTYPPYTSRSRGGLSSRRISYGVQKIVDIMNHILVERVSL
jgi:hypothetical protein